MRIGIDIDDTITNIKDDLDEAAYQYALSLGKNPSREKLVECYNNPNLNGIYEAAFGFNEEEIMHFLTKIHEDIIYKAIPRPNCVSILKKLKNEDNDIIIITAREEKYHENLLKRTINWLNNNDITYDKLIINAGTKEKVCLSEAIDIFIDDNLLNCKMVESVGIPVIKVRKGEEANCCDDWLKIYDLIYQIKPQNIG